MLQIRSQFETLHTVRNKHVEWFVGWLPLLSTHVYIYFFKQPIQNMNIVCSFTDLECVC
jgi:hypothetical protein